MSLIHHPYVQSTVTNESCCGYPINRVRSFLALIVTKMNDKYIYYVRLLNANKDINLTFNETIFDTN